MKNSPVTPHRSIWNLRVQRWLIPGALAALGIGYTLSESIYRSEYSVTSEPAVMGLLLLGLVGPGLVWVTLTWALRGAEYWEQTQRESDLQRQHLLEINQMSAAMNQELEAHVIQRTQELEHAKQELADKAQVLEQLLTEERRVEEKTRAAIAGELHDGIQQLIVGALYEIQSARDVIERNPEHAPARLAAVQELLRRIESEMRGAIYNLRPMALDVQGLVPAIRECVARFERVAGVKCELKVDGLPRRLTPEVEVAAFRIAQEALNNVQAHAQAKRVELELNFSFKAFSFSVKDDGVGFDARSIQEETRSHLGLIGMRERAASVGGTVEIESHSGRGTTVEFYAPVEETLIREPMGVSV